MIMPTLESGSGATTTISTFLGLNRDDIISLGEFEDMENLSSDRYPLMSQRNRRWDNTITYLGEQGETVYPNIFQGGAVIDGAYLTAQDNTLYWSELQIAGLEAELTSGRKIIVANGYYCYVFPDGFYFNVHDGDLEAGSKDIAVSEAPTGSVSFSLCDAEGNAITATSSATAPESPVNGQYWIDTSDSEHVMKCYSESAAMWVTVPTVYTKLVGAFSGTLKQYDGVTVSGTGLPSSVTGSKIVQAMGGVSPNKYYIVVGLTEQSGTATNVKIERKFPDMDYVVTSNNRAWGCRYEYDTSMGVGEVTTINEIYASSLGDITNWNRFQGISTDSYVASIGGAGRFTGAAVLGDNPIFFKSDRLYKVYASSTGAHQIVEVLCDGIWEGYIAGGGNGGSCVVIDGALYYKSKKSVMKYDGNTFYDIGKPLGDIQSYVSFGAAFDKKYYLFINNEYGRSSGRTNLGSDACYVYDTETGIWHKESCSLPVGAYASENELFFAEKFYEGSTAHFKMNCVSNMRSGNPDEGDAEWFADTGIIGYADINQKYISKIDVRMNCENTVDFYIQYDDSGSWEKIASVNSRYRNMRTFNIPITPRRCDSFKLRMKGSGEVKIYSMSLVYDYGSDKFIRSSGRW